MTRRLLIPIIVFIFVCAHIITPQTANASEYTHSTIAGQNVSDFSSTTLEGDPIDGGILSESRLTVFYFWATWSAPCLAQLELYQRAFEAWQAEGVNIIGLLHEDGASTVSIALDYLNTTGCTYTNMLTDEVWSSITAQSEYMPQTFFVTGDGIIAEFFPGVYSSYDQLDASIATLLEQYPSQTHNVAFIDGHTGDTIQTQQVPHGAAALPPEPPAHAGYAFAGWSGDYSCIISDAEIIANYVSMTDIMPGDANNDGQLTSDDALLALRAAVGLIELTEYQSIACDMNGDNAVDQSDALLLLRCAIGLI